MVLTKEKDGSNRVCVDFRKLNKITEVDPEPMTTGRPISSTHWHEIPVQDRFDQMILTNTGCTSGCVQNSVCDSSFYGCHLEW